MKPEWTGKVVGRMHVNGVTYEELGAELGIKKAYVGMILGGKRNPEGIQERVETALDAILKRKNKVSTNGKEDSD